MEPPDNRKDDRGGSGWNGLPFDIEDIVGVALADGLRRAGLIVACVAGASGLSALGLAVGEIVVAKSLEPGLLAAAFGRAFWLFLAPLLTGWAVLYVPLVLASGFYFVKAEAPDARVFVAALFLISGIICLSAAPPGWFEPSWMSALSAAPAPPSDPQRAALVWRSVGFFAVAGCCGCFGWLAVVWRQRRRAAEEAHLAEVMTENERRRIELRQSHGTEIADGDFVREDPP